MGAIPDDVVVAAVETMLRSVGNPVLRYYMPASQAKAIEAMRGILTAERQRALDKIEEVRVSPAWSGRAADDICGACATEIAGDA